MNTVTHYDLLIDENNDPVHDPEPLRAYMDKWEHRFFAKNDPKSKRKLGRIAKRQTDLR